MRRLILILPVIFLSISASAKDYTEVDQIHPAVGGVFADPGFSKALESAKFYLKGDQEGLQIGLAKAIVHAPSYRSEQKPYVEISIDVYPLTGGGCVSYPIGQIHANADGNWIPSNISFQPATEISQLGKAKNRCK